MKVFQHILLVALAASFSGCDKLPIPDPNRAAMKKEEDGKAIGGACRHAGRAIEDCYKLNPKASKASVFAGWREMNDYMTQNKLEVVLPTILPTSRKNVSAPAEPAHETDSANEDAQAKPHAERNPALTAG